MKKRIIAVFLAVVMVVGVLPVANVGAEPPCPKCNVFWIYCICCIHCGESPCIWVIDGVLIFPDDITHIEGLHFGYHYTSVVIPSSVTHIEEFAFHGVGDIKTVMFKSPTPPEIGYIFGAGKDAATITVYVPVGAKAAYQVAFQPIIDVDIDSGFKNRFTFAESCFDCGTCKDCLPVPETCERCNREDCFCIVDDNGNFVAVPYLPGSGDVFGTGEPPDIMNALEILMLLAGLDNVMQDEDNEFAEYAMRAAIIVQEDGKETPDIMDALEILMYLADLPSLINT